jgi:hypothetical protein
VLTQYAIKCPQCRVDLDSTPPLCKFKIFFLIPHGKIHGSITELFSENE